MKFTIEVAQTAEGGHEKVLHRAVIDEISPRRAKTKADTLLGIWRGRGATVARVLNYQGDEVYSAT